MSTPTVMPLPSIEALAAQLESLPAIPGTVVDATVSRVDADWVWASLEGGEGRAPLSEFGKPPMAGAAVRLYIDELDDQGLLLSLHKAERLDLHARLAAAQEAGTALSAQVLKVDRGGLAVQVLGVKAFLAANHIERRPGRLDAWLGQSLDVRILTLDGFKGRIEVARADLPIESAEEIKARLFETLEVGQTVEGTVRRLANFGAFVDLGGFDGLIPTSELTWGRVRHPKDAVREGDVLEVKVLKVDAEKERISLSRKALLPDPWLTIEEAFPAGTLIEGTVTGLAEYGAFVAIAPGMEGLIHISELRWGDAPKSPRSVLKRGQAVTVKIIEADGNQRRIRLSLRQAQANPWAEVEQRYPPGTRIRGAVRSVTKFGVFIGVAEGVDGLVHASDIAWGRSLRNLGEHYAPGDMVEAMVLHVDLDRQRLSLGIKQLTADNSAELYADFEPGAVITGSVVRVVDFGAFVAIADGIEGLVHRTEIADPSPAAPRDVLAPGDTVQVRVLSVDADAGRISLSIKQAPAAQSEASQADPIQPPAGDAIVPPPIAGLTPSAMPPPAAPPIAGPSMVDEPPSAPEAAPAEASHLDILVKIETPAQAEAAELPPPGDAIVPPPIASLTPSIVPPPVAPVAFAPQDLENPTPAVADADDQSKDET